ncbi:cyclic nucleotide-binding domain-containing protein [Desulfovibrio mangrovi]|uniref:Crp/Fnr family transcriptional regulator n=1 Tax=Desulfovibrio mangrovi TaxID=2976983 RepID=UPI002247C862|nr:cyclic nucleotide-binding domain-containing protein [Desulfovibrio mangrovi]UZP67277.1 cyclic nucleotide-binding domain-containing protein [Desulfovibrio mangrovi]
MSSYVVRTFLKYSVIFSEGSRGDSAYLLQEGRVELSKEVHGKKKVLAILNPINMFGEMSLILDDNRRTATAIALDDVRAVEVKKDDFDNFVRDSPQIMQTLIDVLVHRLRASTKKSMQVPSLFQGTCRTIELLARNGVRQFDYMHALMSLKDAFVSPEDKVLDILHKLEHLRMIGIISSEDGVKLVNILEPEHFTVEAAKRLQAYSRGESF